MAWSWAVAILWLCATTATAELCEDLTATTPREADVACLERFLETEQSWPPGIRDQATERLAELTQEAAELSDINFYVRVAAIVALADNGHTSLTRSPVTSQFGLLPIRTYWFDDGLVVTRATREHRKLLGARVLEIAGHSPEALMARMQTYFGGTDENFRAYGQTTWFLSPALLHATQASPSPDTVRLLLQLASGERITVDLATHASTERHPGDYPWRQLHPEPLPREGDAWVSWLGEAETPIPWALDDPEQLFLYRFLAEPSVAHIQLRANISTDDADLGDFLKTLERRLKADGPRHLVWDQRWNSGGDLSRTADFALKLHKLIPPDGKIYVLTSNATFSAGIYTAYFPEWADPERTVVVGTRVGDRERFWAETGRAIVLPETGWRLFYSLKLHDLAQGCDDRNLCHIRRKRWKLAVGSFDPEQPIPEVSADLLEGRDAALDWVLADLTQLTGLDAAPAHQP